MTRLDWDREARLARIRRAGQSSSSDDSRDGERVDKLLRRQVELLYAYVDLPPDQASIRAHETRRELRQLQMYADSDARRVFGSRNDLAQLLAARQDAITRQLEDLIDQAIAARQQDR